MRTNDLLPEAVAPPDVEQLARRLIWWKPPEESLRTPERVIAQAMALGTWDDLETAKRHWGIEAFRRVLASAPPGVFDRRSWNYWHVVFGVQPVPELPVKKLFGAEPVKLSFFGGLPFGPVKPPDQAANGIAIASLEDLYATKLTAPHPAQ